MEPDGVGSLYLAFEALKQRLEKEGLFAPEHKKKIPKIPFRIGIITASGGAAVRDMIQITQRRFPAARIYLYPSAVQGAGAAEQLTQAVRALDEAGLCDVILVGRGGGSIEDLWAFNDENLARAIYACRTPIISAVGHETDFTIADFVADLRAPTPSAAAELAVPDVRVLQKQFGNLAARMASLLQGRVQLLEQRLAALSTRPVFKSPQAYFDDRSMAVGRLEERLCALTGTALERRGAALLLSGEKLQSLNPLRVLERGYSVAFDEAGGVIRSAASLPVGARFTLRLSDGSVRAESAGQNGKERPGE